MYDYITYKDRQGKDEISNFIEELAKKATTSKTERVLLKKIFEYLDILCTYGTRIGEPYVGFIEDGIWELRPSSERIFFFYWKDETFVLLHHFHKKTQKTPPQEIAQAKRNRKDWIERKGK